MNIQKYIRNIPDFPKKGIQYKDMTPLLANYEATNEILEMFVKKYKYYKIDYIAGMEARGFIFGSMLAMKLKVGFLMLRKPNKLPGEKLTIDYLKEYGVDQLEISKGMFPSGSNVLIIDDLLATGGTAMAACKLIEKAEGKVIGCGFVIELKDLSGREILEEKNGYKLFSCLKC